MRVVAFYLPQFHEIPENNEWWGKGFTEWTTVRNAKPWIKNHIQPEVPWNKEYYNLLDPLVMRKQSQMALEYGVDAFCYYHYWFNGKLLLEKPLEMMRNDETIKIPYFFCWANESWARTWDGQDSKCLIKQNYDENEEEIVNHYKYLSNFFFDERYIKVNNRPVIIIYKPLLIKNIALLIKIWNREARNDGFDGIYWGFQHPSTFKHLEKVSSFDFGIEFEPLYTDVLIEGERAELAGGKRILYGIKHPKWLMSKVVKRLCRRPSIRDYDEIWKNIISRKPRNKKIAAGAFPSWDNTPRKGDRGIVFWRPTPEKFKEYMIKQISHAEREYNNNFLFINAWNEWGEGAHLEPDEHNGWGYLEALKSAKTIACGKD